MKELDLLSFQKESKSTLPARRKLRQRLRKVKSKELNLQFGVLQKKVFSGLDCLTCANCCKTTSPILLHTDIDRLVKIFRIKSSAFIGDYLRWDKEGDYVLDFSPCPFLGGDDKCLVY